MTHNGAGASPATRLTIRGQYDEAIAREAKAENCPSVEALAKIDAVAQRQVEAEEALIRDERDAIRSEGSTGEWGEGQSSKGVRPWQS